ncbi:MAG TPA: RNA 2',3'-cyclic phosphodiesterase [Clostridiaceae bacterium]|nr:RNA 2',3'-cyclic phosphodiesterase [Clostridiaceae bacterium]
MRLFIAIVFNDQIKNKLSGYIQRLKAGSVHGNFTLRDNLHLTIIFIGETERMNEVKEAMDKIDEPPFNITLRGIGRFRREGGDIYWMGAMKNNTLSGIYNKLYRSLGEYGFSLENRKFKPHLTMGREVILSEGFNRDAFSKAILPVDMDVAKISLMKSERINGRLTYTEVYAKLL